MLAIVVVGVLLIGLGILSFIAANWFHVPRWFRIVTIIAAYGTSVLAAYLLESRRRPTEAGALLFFSGFLLMGGTVLISQAFHIRGDLKDLLFVWLFAYTPTFLLARNLPVYLLYDTVSLFYVNLLYLRYPHDYFLSTRMLSLNPSILFRPWPPLFLLILIVGSAWAIHRADPAKRTTRLFFGNLFLANWLAWILTWLMAFSTPSETPYLFFFLGLLISGAIASLMGLRLRSFKLDVQGLVLTGVSGLALTFSPLWRWGGGAWIGPTTVGPVAVTLWIGAYLTYRTARGGRDSMIALVFLFALLMRWYFDMFYSFMSKSLFFTSAGVILLGTTYLYRRLGKRATKRGEKDHDA